MSTTIHPIRPAEPPLPRQPAMAVHAYMQAILGAATALMRAGHEILAFYAETITASPTIWIRDTPAVRGLVVIGQASYDHQGADDRGPYRVGSFDCAGVRVQWFERVVS